MDIVKRKPRAVETDGERDERHKRAERMKAENAAAADDAIDAMIKRSINLYGA